MAKRIYRLRDAKIRRAKIYRLRKQTDLTLEEIGEIFGVSGERIRKICLREKEAGLKGGEKK